MPIKRRRKIHEFGAITAGNNTVGINMSEFTSAIVFADQAGTNGAVITVQVSPDGSSWHDLFDADDNQVTYTLGAVIPKVALQVPVISLYMRVAVTVQDCDGIWIEGIREIA